MRGLELIMQTQGQWEALKKNSINGTNKQTDICTWWLYDWISQVGLFFSENKHLYYSWKFLTNSQKKVLFPQNVSNGHLVCDWIRIKTQKGTKFILTLKKNPAYGRHQISKLMRWVTPKLWNSPFCLLFNHIFALLYYTILYYTIQCYTILYYTILHYTALHWASLKCTVLLCTAQQYQYHCYYWAKLKIIYLFFLIFLFRKYQN